MTGRGLPPPQSRTPRVVVAAVTVWVVATAGVAGIMAPDLLSWLIVAPVVLAYLTVVGLPVYFVMKRWGKRSIVGYTAAALVAGVPISSLWVVGGVWMGALYYLAVAAVCGPIGYWIVERT